MSVVVYLLMSEYFILKTTLIWHRQNCVRSFQSAWIIDRSFYYETIHFLSSDSFVEFLNIFAEAQYFIFVWMDLLNETEFFILVGFRM